MSKRSHKPFTDQTHDLHDGLAGLFDVLADAVTDVIAKLDDGTAGTVSRDHIFDTANGPIRAQAGVKIRMGNHDGDDKSVHRFNAKNDGDGGKAEKPPTKKHEPLDYNIIEDDTAWLITADLPGVPKADLSISQDEHTLLIQTSGARLYAVKITLPQPFEIATAHHTLRNGILSLSIPKDI